MIGAFIKDGMVFRVNRVKVFAGDGFLRFEARGQMVRDDRNPAEYFDARVDAVTHPKTFWADGRRYHVSSIEVVPIWPGSHYFVAEGVLGGDDECAAGRVPMLAGDTGQGI